jgi:hypothetical protein
MFGVWSPFEQIGSFEADARSPKAIELFIAALELPKKSTPWFNLREEALSRERRF